MHPLVKHMLDEDGYLYQRASQKVQDMWHVIHQKSGWTNAKQHLAVELQQNLEVGWNVTRILG